MITLLKYMYTTLVVIGTDWTGSCNSPTIRTQKPNPKPYETFNNTFLNIQTTLKQSNVS